MFFKKKPVNEVKVSHYEGLSNFPQNAACLLKIENEHLIIEGVVDKNRASLALERLRTVEQLPDISFFPKYKSSNAPPRGRGMEKIIPIYWILHYTSPEGVNKHLVFLSIANLKVAKFFENLKATIPAQHVTL